MIQSKSVPRFVQNESIRSITRSHSDSEWKDTWKTAAMKAKEVKDPWAKYDIASCYETEKAFRFRYNALEKKWIKDKIEVKMQRESFGRGAMRKCFRTKKLSKFSHSKDWNSAANYVAKNYIEEVARRTYFDDVKIQMDAKIWAEEYNRQNPPKKVDIFQVYIIELIEREGSPLFHFEHFIEGSYVKYNSNSGFVLAEVNFRMTPQAFSHFTFERSGHQLIVVDIQGVGDLYTDPQIHTSCGSGYGDANLGTKGMALFFASHQCNKICKDLGLTPFDLSPLEERRIDDILTSSEPSTRLRNTYYIGKRKMSAMFDLVERLSDNSGYSSDSSSDMESPRSPYLSDAISYESSIDQLSSSDSSVSSYPENDGPVLDSFFSNFGRKKSSVPAHNVFYEKPSNTVESQLPELISSDKVVEKNDVDYENVQETVLGEIHLELCRYNFAGRFTDNQPDTDSALFHLEQASSCDIVEANRELAKIYMQLPHEILAEYTVEETEYNYNKGMAFLLNAAFQNDRDCMLLAAKAYDDGQRLGSRERSWPEALYWYEKLLESSDYAFGDLCEYPAHKIFARMAEMCRDGCYGLEKDLNRANELFNSAAEAALNAMKGKLANKYYVLAEEALENIEG